MKHLALLAFVGLGLPARAQDSARALVFAPAAGARLERRIEVVHALDLVGLASGPANGGELRRSTPDLRIESKLALELGDELVAVGGGRPERLRRRVRTGLYHVELGPKAAAGSKARYDVRTPLEGASIVYTWVPEEQDWGRYYDEREEVEEFLAPLRQDTDLLALLPAQPVRPGDAWSVPAARLADVFAPCGRLPWTWPKELDRAMVRTLSTGIGGGLGELFGGSARGEARATLARVETRDGEELAIVTLALDLELERDQGEAPRDKGALDEGTPPPVAGGMHVRWGFQGTGELAWDLGAARARSLRLDGEQKVAASVQLGALRQEMQLAGRLTLSVDVTPAK